MYDMYDTVAFKAMCDTQRGILKNRKDRQDEANLFLSNTLRVVESMGLSVDKIGRNGGGWQYGIGQWRFKIQTGAQYRISASKGLSTNASPEQVALARMREVNFIAKSEDFVTLGAKLLSTLALWIVEQEQKAVKT